MVYRLCALLLILTTPAWGAAPQMRVALVTQARQVILTGRNFYCYPPTTPDAERTRFPRQAAQIHYTGAGFTLDKEFFLGQHLECLSGEGLLTINGQPTQGRVALIPDGSQKTTVVVTIPMEQYLLGVMQGEVGANWPTEAMKAQSIAARSYALAMQRERRTQPFDVVTHTADQMYQAKIKIPTTIQAAVLDTQGQILVYPDKPLKAFYHSSCGGKGEDFAHVRQDLSPSHASANFPPPTSKDNFCKASPHSRWQTRLGTPDMFKALTALFPKITSLDHVTLQTADNGRVQSLHFEGGTTGVTITGNQLRKALGYETIKSTWFTLKQRRTEWIFAGRGFGHGVGMCQWGAKGMAERGKTAADILQFYYPGSKIQQLY